MTPNMRRNSRSASKKGQRNIMAEKRRGILSKHGLLSLPKGRFKPHIDPYLAGLAGRQLHDAVKQRILAPASPQAQIFIDWFRELFELDD